jgi:uncharacterized protein (TIGR03435 family)
MRTTGKIALIIAAVTITVVPLLSQNTPAFDVVSVKLQPFTGQGSFGISLRGDTLDAEHVSLKELVTFAYDVRDVQVSGGPSWADRTGVKLNDAELYQVVGKAAGNTPPSKEQFRRMLQSLLADRFHLQVHHQPKDLPVYNLVANRDGVKLKESAAGAKFSARRSSLDAYAIRIEASGAPMQWIVSEIEGYADRPVFDKTRLMGTYDIVLECVVGNLPVGAAANASRPSLFTALQEQLGLKLEAALSPLDTVVIDHAERPTPN